MKLIRVILWIIVFVLFVLGLLYLFTGSLEMFPTAEQQEKMRIVSIVMMVIATLGGVLLILTRKKQGTNLKR